MAVPVRPMRYVWGIVLCLAVFALPIATYAQQEDADFQRLIDETKPEALAAAKAHLARLQAAQRALQGGSMEELEQRKAELSAATRALEDKIRSLDWYDGNARNDAAKLIHHWRVVWAQEAQAEAAQAQAAAAAEAQAQANAHQRRIYRSIAVTVVVPLFIGYFIPRYRRMGKPSKGGWDTPLPIPKHLARAHVQGISYPLEWGSGLVIDKEERTALISRTEYVGGKEGSRVVVDTSQYGEFWLLNHEGREKSWRVVDFNVSLRPSNVVTGASVRVGKGHEFLFIYNHSTQRLFVDKERLNQIHRIPWLLTCTATFLAASAGILYTRAPAGALYWQPPGGGEWAFLVVAPALIAAVALTMFVEWWMRWRRTRRFCRRFLRKVERYLDEQSDAMLEVFLQPTRAPQPVED